MTDENSDETPQFHWISKRRNYKEEALDCVKSVKQLAESNNHHPLKPSLIENVSNTRKSSSASSTKSTYAGFDPLNSDNSAGGSGVDPLSKMVADVSFKERQEMLKLNEIKSSFEPWSLKKPAILSKYTTVEKLTITSSFLTPIAGAVKDKAAAVKNLTTVSDKIKDRLEKLDQFDDDNMLEMANLSQQDYIKRIDELNNALLSAWNEDDRVKTLKIVIQCAKLLADTSVIQFYPSKFVLITDVLDTFGQLVYERIKTKSLYQAPGSAKAQPLPENFTADIVPATAKETCRNWFFKIASIRELLPRIYVEAAILKCVNFLSDETISKPINRLIGMTAGIGDPLVAIYTKCYICRVGVSIDSSIRDYQLLSMDNLLFVFRQISSERIKRLLINQKIDLKTYLELYCPAIDWIFQCVSNNRTQDYLREVVDKCVLVSNENRIVNGLLINSMMSSLDPDFISSIARKIVEMIKESDDDYFPKHLLFRNLGMCLAFNESSGTKGEAPKTKEEKEKNKNDLQLLNDVWKIVTKFTVPNEYLGCAEIWIEFTLKNFSKKEINTLLGDIVKHVLPDRTFERFYPQLQSIMSKTLLLFSSADFNSLFSMDKFMQFFNLFQKDSIKIDVCKSITQAFLRHNQHALIADDVVVMNAMMQICKSMHDYVNALTLDDEKRDIATMICSFINKLDMSEKEKMEQYLSFFSDARASFSSLDSVIALLVHKVNRLSVDTLKCVNYEHTRKTAAFVRACIAYSFITIPSLTNPILKLQLYLESSQVALLNQCLSQTDAFLKSAISLIPDVQKQIEAQHASGLSSASLNFDASSLSRFASGQASLTMANIEKYLNDFLQNMMSTLLVIPDNPEQGVLYLLTGVLNLIEKHFAWENVDIKFSLLVKSLVALSALRQEEFLYHVNGVESNDTLYGSDSKYLKELNGLVEMVVKSLLKQIENANSSSKQSSYALELFNHLISHADLSNEQTLAFAQHLWTLALKNGTSKFHEQIIAAIRNRSHSKSEYKVLRQKLGLKV